MKRNSYTLTAEQLSLILNISEFTTKKLAKAKQLPCKFINRRPFFDLDKIRLHFKKIEEDAV